ncbi:hypothetical protein CALVIDRAFT_195657 [Calocera viscosa TUFC12733]|uniref:F-box domain-containing protein n=1 Tax=Calocera viscosa (strain TUFC12733) TaxID=1330018 RepID=A0A167KGU3_CALVF|nr:hypothetical protein CALVIDRAFT_195657 [Calocera viscosa TUFC12733]
MLSMNTSYSDPVFQRVHVPIHKLNADILLHVFGFCRDIQPVSVWSLSYTCGRWRRLVLEHPSLSVSHVKYSILALCMHIADIAERWTRVAVDRSTLRRLGSLPPFDWLTTWLSRSGTDRPLDIIIDLHDVGQWYHTTPTRDDMYHILLVVCHHAHRWRSFSYLLGEAAIKTGGPFDTNAIDRLKESLTDMPRLQWICVAQERFQLDDGITPDHFLRLMQPKAALHLRRMPLANISDRALSTQWNVHHLSYRISIPCRSTAVEQVWVRSVLRMCSSVRTLRLTGWSDGADDPPGVRRAVLRQLRHLEVAPNSSMMKVLSFVDMPCLTALTLKARLIPERDEVMGETAWDRQMQSAYSDTFLDRLLLRPDALPLSQLVLYLPFLSVPWHSIVHFKTLETISIVKPKQDSFWSICPSNLFALYERSKQDDMDIGWCLPRLHNLTLRETGGNDSVNHAVAALFRRLEVEMKELFKARWEDAHGKDARIISLDFDIIMARSKIKIRYLDRKKSEDPQDRL